MFVGRGQLAYRAEATVTHYRSGNQLLAEGLTLFPTNHMYRVLSFCICRFQISRGVQDFLIKFVGEKKNIRPCLRMKEMT